MNKIIGLGNALVDILVVLEEDKLLNNIGLPKGSMQLISESKYHEINSLFSKMKTFRATGGSAANTILALANLQLPVGFIGKVGVDDIGLFFQKKFQSKGIDTRLLQDKNLSSGVASTFISPDGERTFGTYLGAASQLLAEDIYQQIYSGYDILYLEGYLVQNHELIEKALKLAKEQGLKVCIDLASYNIVAEDLDFFTHLVEKYVDVVFANEEEALAFSQTNDAEVALKYIASLCPIAVVKIGSKGAYVRANGTSYHAKALSDRKVLDTTGAGDYFAAGFLYGYVHGLSLLQCAQIGSLLSAHVIEVVGTSLEDETWKNIMNDIKLIVQNN